MHSLVRVSRFGVMTAALILLSGCGNKPATPPDTTTTGNTGAATSSADPKPEAAPHEDFIIADLDMELKAIDSGSFKMGANHLQAPEHEVTISKPFWMSATEVTQAQYQSIMGANPSFSKGEDLPVESVTWAEASKFAEKLTAREKTAGRLPAGHAYRLPTEAEWEYACRAGSVSSKPDGDLSSLGWYSGNSGRKTHPVGSKQPNPWGLYDMYGNVVEWCHDWHAAYPARAATDPKGPSNGTEKVMRGGGFTTSDSRLGPATRFSTAPTEINRGRGFRIVLAPAG